MGKYFDTEIAKLATYLTTFLVAILMFNSANAPGAYAAETASISSTASGGIVELSQLMPSSTTGAYTSGRDTVNVTTSCSSGYKVYVSGTSDSKYGTNLVNTSDNAATITTTSSAIGSETSISSNTTSSWGIRLGSGDTFAGLPTYAAVSGGTAKELYSGSDLSKSLDIYYGVNVTSSTIPGAYEGKVLYTVIMNDACYYYPVTVTAGSNISSTNITATTKDANGKVKKDDAVTISATPNTGYHFTSWTVNSGGVTLYSNSAMTTTSTTTTPAYFKMPENSVTVTANATANTYTVAYAAGSTGGSCSVSSTSATYDANVTLSSTKCTKDGYTQDGWSTSSAASNTKTYTLGQAVTKPNFTSTNGGTYTLYPHFTANTVTVSFNANGGSGTTMSNQTFTYNTSQALSANTYTRSGYTFKGWSTSSTATTATYTDKQSVTASTLHSSVTSASQTRTLYAVWEVEAASGSMAFAQAGVATNSYMQDFPSGACAKVKIGESVTLKDKRDNVAYSVKKLSDERCWMVQNLRWTGTSDGAHTTSGSATTDANSNTSGKTINFVSGFTDSSNTALNARYNGSTTAGAFYSWAAAQYVCPLKWRLPTGGTSGEFVELDKAINPNSASKGKNRTEQAAASNFASTSNGYPGFVRSGFYALGTFWNNSDTQGLYWTSTAKDSSSAYSLYLTMGSNYYVGPATTWDIGRGYNVRCILN